MRRSFLVLLMSIGIASRGISLPTPVCEEEALFVRRIGDCWQDKEYACAKYQIEEFLACFPKSQFTDHFYVMLGDLAAYERAFEEALYWYAKVNDPNLKKSIPLKRWNILYQLKNYSILRDEISVSTLPFSEESQFYYAETYFREALSFYEDRKEEALNLFQEATPYYQALISSSSFSYLAKLSLAEIYRLQGASKEAAKLYLEIVESPISPQEELLFHAAHSLSFFDPAKAAQLFEKIAREGKKMQQESALCWFQLLIKMQAWTSIEANAPLFLSLIPSQQLALCHFYLGKINHDKNFFSSSLQYLKESLKGPLTPSQEKTALFLIMKGAKELNDLTSFEIAYHHFKEKEGHNAPEFSLLQVIRAELYRKHGNVQKAFRILEKNGGTEEGVIEKIRLLLSQKQFAESYAECEKYLSLHPDSEKMKHLGVEISMTALSIVETRDNYELLAQNLERFLYPNNLTKEEEEKYFLLLAKAYYSLDQLEACRDLLENIVENLKFFLHEAHFLLALSYWKMDNQPKLLILHGERALRLYPSHPEAAHLHLALFNAYLDLSKEKADDELSYQACEHLYKASETLPISLEKRLWMSHEYNLQAHRMRSEKEAKKAIGLIEPLLDNKEQWLQFEEEALLLASLYGFVDQIDKQGIVLNKLSTLQAEHPQMRWKYKEKTQLELANLDFYQKKWEKIKPIYEKLENSFQERISSEARLQLSRVMIQLLTDREKSEGSSQAFAIIQRLKDLQLRKVLSDEPIHLEAAIERSEFCASLKIHEKQEEALLQSLLKVKEDFSSQEDRWSQDYQSDRQRFPDKDIIYQAYMRYIDARIYLIQSSIAKKMGNLLEAKEKEKIALALFSSLLQEKCAVTKYLVRKTIESTKDRQEAPYACS